MSQASDPTTSDSSNDPYQEIRENRDAVESLAEQDREDSLAAWARVMLALTDGEQPDRDDLEKTGLPVPGEQEGES